MLAIINAVLVMRDHLIPDGYILIEDGLIKDYGEMFKARSFDGYEIIDAKGAYVGPGLVNIHCQAADERKFVDDPIHSVQFMLKHGTTTILPGHQGFSAIDDRMVGNYNMPMTLSNKIITGLLKGEMQFDGIVVTHAINMAALKTAYPAEVEMTEEIRNEIRAYNQKVAEKALVLQCDMNKQIPLDPARSRMPPSSAPPTLRHALRGWEL